MKLFFLVLCTIGVSATATSQIDFINNTNTLDGFKIEAEIQDDQAKSTPYQSSQNHSLTDPAYKNGFLKPTDFFKKEEEPVTMSTDHGLRERRIDFEPDYLKRDKDKDSGGRGNQTTQYLGEFTSAGKFVEIYCRDHEYVDGDRVQVLINGKVVAQNIVLSGSFRPVLVTLEKGFNRIEIKALNEGTSSPNTAEFMIYGEDGNVITRNQWNLATGVKASILINKP